MSEPVDLISCIQKIALLATIRPDSSATLRKIKRWYSETFHTPLDKVDDLSLEYVLLNYFEASYANMEEKDLQKQILQSLETPQERHDREIIEENEDLEYLRILEEEQAAINSKKLEDLPKPQKPSISESMPDLPDKVEIKVD